VISLPSKIASVFHPASSSATLSFVFSFSFSLSPQLIHHILTTKKPPQKNNNKGGKAVMNFALEHPERVKAMIVVDVAPRRYNTKKSFGDLISALQSLPLDTIRSRKDANTFLAPLIPVPYLLLTLCPFWCLSVSRFDF
jgi:hypothetical protein